MMSRKSWYTTIVREKTPVTEEQFISDYEQIKEDINFLWNMFLPNKGYVEVPGGSVLTAPIEVDLIEVLSEDNAWAREHNMSERLKLFLRLKER
jgi:hypothetical protein